MKDGKPPNGDARRRLFHLAKELDRMDRDVTSWEASFLDSVMKALESGREITPKQEGKLKGMYLKYMSGPEEEPGDEEE